PIDQIDIQVTTHRECARNVELIIFITNRVSTNFYENCTRCVIYISDDMHTSGRCTRRQRSRLIEGAFKGKSTMTTQHTTVVGKRLRKGGRYICINHHSAL